MDRSDTPATTVVTQEVVRVKMPLPDNYDGSRTKLKAFIMQAELYIGFNQIMFANEPQKVLWAASFMRGRAFEQIQTFIEDHLSNLPIASLDREVVQKDIRNNKTKILFLLWNNFKNKICQMFGDIDKEHIAKKALNRLRQKGAATAYAAEF